MLIEFFKDFILEDIDTRSNEYLILRNHGTVCMFVITYLAGVFLLPKLTKGKAALELKSLIYLYNVCQIVLNSWIIYEFIKAGWTIGYFGCVPVDNSITPEIERSARALSVLVWIKIFDFIETFVFIFRKKFNQVTFLHVVHHVITVNLVWLGARYVPGGSTMTPWIINSFIHVLMYSYYLLSAMGFRKLNFFKQFLTTMQLIQFVVVIIMYVLHLKPSCQYPAKNAIILSIVSSFILFFILFMNFYVQSYIKPKSKVK